MNRKAWHSQGNLVRREYFIPSYLKRTGMRNPDFRLNFCFERDFSFQPLVNDKVLTLKMNLGYYDDIKAKIRKWKKNKVD